MLEITLSDKAHCGWQHPPCSFNEQRADRLIPVNAGNRFRQQFGHMASSLNGMVSVTRGVCLSPVQV